MIIHYKTSIWEHSPAIFLFLALFCSNIAKKFDTYFYLCYSSAIREFMMEGTDYL